MKILHSVLEKDLDVLETHHGTEMINDNMISHYVNCYVLNTTWRTPNPAGTGSTGHFK